MQALYALRSFISLSPFMRSKLTLPSRVNVLKQAILKTASHPHLSRLKYRHNLNLLATLITYIHLEIQKQKKKFSRSMQGADFTDRLSGAVGVVAARHCCSVGHYGLLTRSR